MANNRFFTWAGTKNDRKHASAGIVPIPVECISIKGMEYGRKAKDSRKASRKPLPLDFAQTPDTTSSQSSRTHDSIALHDAAVQSATSLMAVMSDMLKSPQLSAHLLSTQQQGGLQPMHTRPRSRTAPPTPLVEAPVTEPVELPGSIPVWPKPRHSRQSIDIKSIRGIRIPDNDSVGKTIERPHSSPQEPTHKTPVYSRQSCDSFSRSMINLQPPPDGTPRRKDTSPCPPNERPIPSVSSSRENVSMSDTQAGHSTKRRLSFQTLPHHKSASSSGSFLSTQGGSTYSGARSDVALPAPREFQIDAQFLPDADSLWMDQIAVMRAGHDAHIASLKEAHDRDIASHREYISLLERRRVLSPAPQPRLAQHLTIDTSNGPGRPGASYNEVSSATTSLQSFESSLETHKRASAEAIAETEALRRKLSLAHKAQAELGDVRRERDHFKEATERGDKRIIQLKDIVRKAKETEKASKNMISSLEASVQAANMERIDVLEGFHEACEQIKRLSDRQQSLVKDRGQLQRKANTPAAGTLEQSRSMSEPECGSNAHSVEKRRATLRDDPLLQQLDDLRQLLAEKDSRISQLEDTEERGTRPLDDRSQQYEVKDRAILQQQLDTCRVQRDQAIADRDRYDALLHTELRRQTKVAAQKDRATTPQIEDEATALVTQRLRRLSMTPNGSQDQLSQNGLDGARPANFEQELKHCIQEIIMYKLDVKGYKKDLKAANAKIEALEISSARPQTPDSHTGRSARTIQYSEDIPPYTEAPPSAGLGISFVSQRPPNTPPSNNIPSTTSNTFLSATPTPMPSKISIPIASPASRPKTPLGAHKRLPKPPPRTPSPNPHLPSPAPRKIQSHIHRQETLRSLSESIISSYAKRGATTPEQQPLPQMPPLGHSSDPPRLKLASGGGGSVSGGGEGRSMGSGEGIQAIAVPVRKYSSEMLKTLRKSATPTR